MVPLLRPRPHNRHLLLTTWYDFLHLCLQVLTETVIVEFLPTCHYAHYQIIPQKIGMSSVEVIEAGMELIRKGASN